MKAVPDVERPPQTCQRGLLCHALSAAGKLHLVLQETIPPLHCFSYGCQMAVAMVSTKMPAASHMSVMPSHQLVPGE